MGLLPPKHSIVITILLGFVGFQIVFNPNDWSGLTDRRLEEEVIEQTCSKRLERYLGPLQKKWLEDDVPAFRDLIFHNDAYYAIFNKNVSFYLNDDKENDDEENDDYYYELQGDESESKDDSQNHNEMYKWSCGDEEGYLVNENSNNDNTLIIKCNKLDKNDVITAVKNHEDGEKEKIIYNVTEHMKCITDGPIKVPAELSSFTTSIPKKIFMLWASGWDTAPLTQILCRKSWELQNPTHTVQALDLKQAEALIDRESTYPDKVWNKLSIQHKSDIIRISLLYKFGGIWADASVYCYRPLIDWIDHDHTDFVSFLRYGIDHKNKQNISPWVTSWFMVGRTNSYVIDKIYNVMSNPDDFHRFSNEVYWLHRIISDLANSDKLFMSFIKELMSADTAHCINREKEHENYSPPKMFKRCNLQELPELIWSLEKELFKGRQYGRRDSDTNNVYVQIE